MTFAEACVNRWRTTSTQFSTPVKTVASSQSALDGAKRRSSSALLFAQKYWVSRRMLVRVRSAAARYRNHVASGTRAAYSGDMLPISRTIALKPPPCRRRSVTRRACSILDHGLRIAVEFRLGLTGAWEAGSKIFLFDRTLCCGSAQRGANISGRMKSLIDSESPFTSLRG